MRLDDLAHEDLLETPGTHSKSRNVSATGFTFAAHLGLRRLFNFRGVHADHLTAALAALAPELDAAGRAERGRLKRLLGDTAGARRNLLASFEAAPSARAAGWLGELYMTLEPAQAASWLEKATGLDPAWAWPHLWSAAAALSARKLDAVFAALDRFDAFGAATPLSPLLRCQALIESGQAEAAFAAAERAIALDPRTCAGYGMAGYVRIALGDTEGALRYYDEARNRDPELGGSHLLQGLGIKVDWDSPRNYLATLDAMIAKHPRMAALYAERAELKRDPRLCMYEEGLADYQKASELDPGAAWILAVLARAQNYAKGLRAGMPAFDRAIALAPESGWIYAWRAEAWRGLGETERALADSDKAVAFMPWYSFAYAWRGALGRGLGRFAEAERDLGTAIRLEPDYLFSYYERFQCRRLLGDWTGALADLNHAYRQDPKYSWLGRASRAGAAAGYATGLRELDQAVAAHPGESWFKAWRGYSWLQQGEPARALADLQAAAAALPEEAVVLSWTGWALLQAGSDKEAAPVLEAAVRIDPKIWFAWDLLAELRSSGGDLKGALDAIGRVAELAPTTATVHFRKAAIEDALGQLEPALRDLNKALELDVRYGAAYLSRAMVRQRLGDYAGQIADFRSALKIAPELFPEEQRAEVARMVGS